jgi:sugar phosphate isomerase/epimerase
MLGVKDVMTHVGFIPEQPSSEAYRNVVSAVREMADYCSQYDMFFNFETGQETPVTLMRAISDAQRKNLGINLDPANLIMYGKGNPVDAVGIFGEKIRGVHVKDGDYPKDDYYRLGKERVVGEGSVNFPVFLPKLLESGYKGDLYIEHEISDRNRLEDVRKVVSYLKNFVY